MGMPARKSEFEELMRVLMALTILLWAGILVSFFVPVPQQSGRPPTAARQ